MTISNSQNLKAVSPINGRYFEDTNVLSRYFSEYALIKYRCEIEIKYLIFLSKLKIVRSVSKREKTKLTEIYEEFSIDDAKTVKKFEQKTRHDVKALEYFIRLSNSRLSTSDLSNWIHFGLTSADINENAYRLMIKDSINTVFLNEINKLLDLLKRLSYVYRKLPMLGRTHGQGAVPTTLGKEIRVFCERLSKEITTLKKSRFHGKFGGAVGNWNALQLAFPNINWPKSSKIFLKDLGIEQTLFTTQVAPAEDIITIFQNIYRINSILIGFNQDMWRYISDDWIVQKGKDKHVGSSTMPQKINPIEFENSEGNLIMANGIIELLCRKLSISRLQRDLSDSTLQRNIGVVFAHSIIAYKSCLKGLQTVTPNIDKIKMDLCSDWSILSEALQTVLRKNGNTKGYEKVASDLRGKNITQTEWKKLINSIKIPFEDKDKLMNLTPENYLGFSDKIIE